jgi:hypothetical protein
MNKLKLHSLWRVGLQLQEATAHEGPVWFVNVVASSFAEAVRKAEQEENVPARVVEVKMIERIDIL